RSHPSLLVTSRVKMRNGREIDFTYDGDISETIDFFRRPQPLRSNWEAGIRLIEDAAATGEDIRGEASGWARRGISPASILSFLADYRVHHAALRVIPKLLADY